MITSSNKNDICTEEDDDEEEVIITSKLQLVLAAKSRKLQYMSSPVVSHHVSMSLLSSPDDLSHTRASVPFSWEEEPGKPKHHHALRAPLNSKRLHLPPRLLLPVAFTKTPLASDHHLLPGLKRWFRWKKDRADDVTGKCSFVFPSENGNETKITRPGDLCSFSDITRCYFWVK
ncbi:hypothetical protein EUTSA_v10006487mg [Eutrema salsugineum]|uniref:Uncharacterized protein n=1 Tax=Eutrema salsugineum TaxID=72664 RepID=V4LJG5_EUTSA|nr:hypothetical protein EUTSA_v10006487mg [Eutrema salsugineum]